LFDMPDTKSSTRIQINYSDEKTAKAIQKAITPDNIELPDGMHIMVLVNDNTLEIEVFSERSIGSLVATLDDLLSCVQAAEKTLEEV
jgi:tRNA threonylcarbamoyladenosine modification (KEOPS) complex  Pcc1 subunit